MIRPTCKGDSVEFYSELLEGFKALSPNSILLITVALMVCVVLIFCFID